MQVGLELENPWHRHMDTDHFEQYALAARKKKNKHGGGLEIINSAKGEGQGKGPQPGSIGHIVG